MGGPKRHIGHINAIGIYKYVKHILDEMKKKEIVNKIEWDLLANKDVDGFEEYRAKGKSIY